MAGWEHKTGAYRPFPKMLPKPKAKASVVAQAMAKMRSDIASNACAAQGKEYTQIPLDTSAAEPLASESGAECVGIKCAACNGANLSTWLNCAHCGKPLARLGNNNPEDENHVEPRRSKD
jgi:hypothetical protein